MPISPREGGYRLRGLLRSHDYAKDIVFFHDDQVLALDLHFGARPLAEQDLIAGLDVERGERAVFRASSAADRYDFAFLRLFLSGVGNDDPASSLGLGLDPADQHAIMKGAKVHSGGILSTGVRLFLSLAQAALVLPS